jgi:error-prone DNA polymerase
MSPFASLGDFLARTRLSRPSLRNLVLSGGLDWTGRARPQILMYARSRGGEVPPIPDFTEEEKVAHELEILGLSARRHLLSYLTSGDRPFDSRHLAASAGRRVRIVGIMATSRIAMTAKEEAMEFVTLEDEHGLFEAVLFPQVFRRCRAFLGTVGPYEVAGRVESRYDSVAITAERIVRASPTLNPARGRGLPTAPAACG